MNDVIEGVAKGLAVACGVLVVVGLIATLLAYFTMLAWNYVVPELFGLPRIEWFQAWVLMLLIHLLFPSVSASTSK